MSLSIAEVYNEIRSPVLRCFAVEGDDDFEFDEDFDDDFPIKDDPVEPIEPSRIVVRV